MSMQMILVQPTTSHFCQSLQGGQGVITKRQTELENRTENGLVEDLTMICLSK